MLTFLLNRVPLLRNWEGRRRLRQMVCDPIPRHIHRPRGGYNGDWGTGFIRTRFEFEPPLNRAGLLDRWRRVEIEGMHRLVQLIEQDYLIELTAVYEAMGKEHVSRWLLLDETRGCGTLYQAIWFRRLDRG